MAPGARWFSAWFDPITFAFRALIPNQFACPTDGGQAPCGTLVDLLGRTVSKYAYVSDKYDVQIGAVWSSIGYLVLFFAAFETCSIVALRYVRHINR